jgi:hypothetical protein
MHQELVNIECPLVPELKATSMHPNAVHMIKSICYAYYDFSIIVLAFWQCQRFMLDVFNQGSEFFTFQISSRESAQILADNWNPLGIRSKSRSDAKTSR